MAKYSKPALGLLGFFAILIVSKNAFGKTKNEIPQPVLAEFHKEFPKIQNVDWNRENKNYEAEFELNKEEISISYNADGQRQETRKKINANLLPVAVLQYTKNHQLGEIEEAVKIGKMGNQTEYEAEINEKDYRFSPQGKLISIDNN